MTDTKKKTTATTTRRKKHAKKPIDKRASRWGTRDAHAPQRTRPKTFAPHCADGICDGIGRSMAASRCVAYIVPQNREGARARAQALTSRPHRRRILYTHTHEHIGTANIIPLAAVRSMRLNRIACAQAGWHTHTRAQPLHLSSSRRGSAPPYIYYRSEPVMMLCVMLHCSSRERERSWCALRTHAHTHTPKHTRTHAHTNAGPAPAPQVVSSSHLVRIPV